MLNLKEDAKCIELENYLNDYVASTNNYWQMRRKHFANGGSKFDVYNNTSDALEKVQNASDNFSNGLASYLQSFTSTQDKQQVVGRFLWKIIKRVCAWKSLARRYANVRRIKATIGAKD